MIVNYITPCSSMCKAGCRLINSSYLFFTLLAIWVRFSMTYCDPQGPLRRLNSAQWHWRQAWKKMLVDWQSLLEEIGTVVEGLLEDRERQWHVHSRSPKILSCNCWRQKGAPHTHIHSPTRPERFQLQSFSNSTSSGCCATCATGRAEWDVILFFLCTLQWESICTISKADRWAKPPSIYKVLRCSAQTIEGRGCAFSPWCRNLMIPLGASMVRIDCFLMLHSGAASVACPKRPKDQKDLQHPNQGDIKGCHVAAACWVCKLCIPKPAED